MVAGKNARFIVETWFGGGATATSIGLAVASSHTKGRHVCIVPDERSRLEYIEALEEVGMSAEAIVGEPDEVVKGLNDIDFMVVDNQRNDCSRILRVAKLSEKGAVLACKNTSSKTT
ncbi:hypothetical protein V6N12_068631 [Hibiscus sabdariffa]|uniref:Uncharacterized protein n=1 Tax=Hibiscus sabdariffa TaxID=183260 RepID=A0ABR2FQP8_9ROSI